jgi:hypothetical protein
MGGYRHKTKMEGKEVRSNEQTIKVKHDQRKSTIVNFVLPSVVQTSESEETLFETRPMRYEPSLPKTCVFLPNVCVPDPSSTVT